MAEAAKKSETKDGSKGASTKAAATDVTSGFDFEVKKRITYPQLKLINDVPVFVKITEKIFKGKEVEAKEGEAKKEPPMLTRVVDLTTGQEMEMICNALLVSELSEAYADDGYIGKCFRIVKLPKREGRRYNGIDVCEIEPK